MASTKFFVTTTGKAPSQVVAFGDLPNPISVSHPSKLRELTISNPISGATNTIIDCINSAQIQEALTEDWIKAFDEFGNELDVVQDISGGIVIISQVNATNLSFQGYWDADINSPALVSSTGTQNHYYIVNNPGSTNLDGISSWSNNDWVVFDGSVWRKLSGSESVISVNGQTGAVNIPIASGGLNYLGLWNANTNDLGLASGVGNSGDYAIVGTAGATNLDGITDWQLNDWAIFNGATWDKIDNSDLVTSVNSQTGTVVLNTGHISEVSNSRYVTDADLVTLSNTSGTNTGDEVQSTTTVQGIIELATQAEVDTGTDTERAITPATLAGSALATNVSTNNSKVSNATHTGEVTGATALTAHPTMISNKPAVTPASGDYVFGWDATDSALKRFAFDDLTGGGDNIQANNVDLIFNTAGSTSTTIRQRYGEGSSITPFWYAQTGNNLITAVHPLRDDIQTKFTNFPTWGSPYTMGSVGTNGVLSDQANYFLLGVFRNNVDPSVTAGEKVSGIHSTYFVQSTNVANTENYGIFGELTYTATAGANAPSITATNRAGIKGYATNASTSNTNNIGNITGAIGHAKHFHGSGNIVTIAANGVVGYVEKENQSLLTTANALRAVFAFGASATNQTARANGLLVEAVPSGNAGEQVGMALEDTTVTNAYILAVGTGYLETPGTFTADSYGKVLVDTGGGLVERVVQFGTLA
jgi:hypothetical protein